jgi:hypothetical protein
MLQEKLATTFWKAHTVGAPPKKGDYGMHAGQRVRALSTGRRKLFGMRQTGLCVRWEVCQPTARVVETGPSAPPKQWAAFLKKEGLDWTVQLCASKHSIEPAVKTIYVPVSDSRTPYGFLHALAHCEHPKHNNLWADRFTNLCRKYAEFLGTQPAVK